MIASGVGLIFLVHQVSRTSGTVLLYRRVFTWFSLALLSRSYVDNLAN